MSRLLHLHWLFHLQACLAPVRPLLPIGAGRNSLCLSHISAMTRIFNREPTGRCVCALRTFVGDVVYLFLSQWFPFLPPLFNLVPKLESAHAGHVE